MPVRGVIFDIDGTLVDTNRQHVEAWRRAFADAGFNVPAERIAVEVGKGGDQLVPAILGKDGDRQFGDKLRHAHGDEFRAIARDEHFALFPGAVELLDRLQALGLKTALATSSPKDLMELTQRRAGADFTKRVDAVVTADDADASKPAPDIVLAVVRKLGVEAGDCAMVGDTPYDGQACRRAGVTFLALACGRCHDAAALREAGAAGLWTDPTDLLAHLDQALGLPTKAGQGSDTV